MPQRLRQFILFCDVVRHQENSIAPLTFVTHKEKLIDAVIVEQAVNPLRRDEVKELHEKSVVPKAGADIEAGSCGASGEEWKVRLDDKDRGEGASEGLLVEIGFGHLVGSGASKILLSNS